ncbi:MAG: hypothetical protein IJH34_09800, partial [Romboutsia sp.]|nr:hypothetical protein [Romboutsia sp.]
EVKLALERRKNEFEDLFNNPFEGTYLINGKEGKMKLEFQDTLYGTLEFSVNYSTTEEVKQLINKNEVKFKYPNIKFKLNDMDKNNNFITIKGYEITQPAIMNKNEEVLNSEFKMIDGSEIRLLNLRIWYVEGNKIVGDIMDENDNIIGTFNMKIKEVVNNTQNPK